MSILEQALELHRTTLPIDLHADTPVLLRWGYDLGQRHEPPLPMSALGFHIDLPRLRDGGMAGQFFGLPSWPVRLFGRGPGAVVDGLIDALERAVRRYPDQLVLARSAADVRSARASGRIAALCGIEGAHALEGRLERAAHFAERGVRYVGLLHFSANQAGFPAFGRGRHDDQGLTDFGRELVDELHRLRVIVDLAHLNRRGFLEVTERARAPLLVSHTGVRGVHPHWRNIDDAQIRAVARTGGCVGVIYSRGYLGSDHLEGVCEHLLHLLKVGGEDLPALGSDWDGFVTPPEGLEDVSRLPNLTAALLERRLTENQVRKILGEHALRVLEAVSG